MSTVRFETATAETPIFSARLAEALEQVLNGEAPNAGHFCGYCYTPIDRKRDRCPQCDHSVEEYRPVSRVPDEVFDMFRRLRRRESLVVNSFAYLGLLLAVFIFIAVFYAIFMLGGGVWWYIFDTALLFVAARALAGLLGGFVGDELGFRYARRKLAEDWSAYAPARGTAEDAPKA